jgi:hypothetical protein
MAKNAIDALCASQVTARKELACGSNSFPPKPLLAPVLDGAEGRMCQFPIFDVGRCFLGGHGRD